MCFLRSKTSRLINQSSFATVLGSITGLYFAANLLLATGAGTARAEVIDVRERIAQETQVYRATHLKFVRAPKHDFRRNTAQTETLSGRKVPGGVGFGYYYDDGALLWTNSSILDYYIITPSTMGGDLNDYLYLTASCRAQLGTEALVSYYGQGSPGFWIFDWSYPSNQWQAGFSLPDKHPEYLSSRVDEFANPRQMCHVRNGTFLTGFSSGQYNWENRVWLFNFPRGDWDLLYSHVYATTNLDSNVFVSGAARGFWGPIVEVFQGGSYDNLNPAGFDLARLLQDGSATSSTSIWLSGSNSYTLQMDPFEVLTETQNRGFVVYTGVAPANVFHIANAFPSASPGQTAIEIDTQTGHQYDLFSTSTPSGPWSATGLPISGNGARMQFQVTNDLQATFFRVRDSYECGSLCVVANTNTADFSLVPPRGIVSPEWVAEPDGQHWAKTAVGLIPGTYTVNFSTIPGSSPLAPKAAVITRGDMSSITADYER